MICEQEIQNSQQKALQPEQSHRLPYMSRFDSIESDIQNNHYREQIIPLYLSRVLSGKSILPIEEHDESNNSSDTEWEGEQIYDLQMSEDSMSYLDLSIRNNSQPRPVLFPHKINRQPPEKRSSAFTLRPLPLWSENQSLHSQESTLDYSPIKRGQFFSAPEPRFMISTSSEASFAAQASISPRRPGRPPIIEGINATAKDDRSIFRKFCKVLLQKGEAQTRIRQRFDDLETTESFDDLLDKIMKVRSKSPKVQDSLIWRVLHRSKKQDKIDLLKSEFGILFNYAANLIIDEFKESENDKCVLVKKYQLYVKENNNRGH